MERKKYTYFLSDLHLGAPYLPGNKEAERRVVHFLDSIKEKAESVYLLGDVLDYWYEYRYAVPRGFVRFFGKLAELSDLGIKIVWFIGNHDIWIFDYIPEELGVEVIDGSHVVTLYGKKLYLAHGDGVGKIPQTFKLIRSIFRNKVCQFLYSGIHPRWTIPFAYRWSGYSRKEGENKTEENRELLVNLKKFAEEYHSIHPEIDYFIFGHLHLFEKVEIAKGCEMIILGEWLKTFSYVRMNEDGIEMLKWTE